MRYTRKKKIENKKQQVKEKTIETKENLTLMLKDYEIKLIRSGYRISRLKELLSRKSVAKLSESKLNKMKRQLSEAEEEHSFSQVAIDQISFRLSQIA